MILLCRYRSNLWSPRSPVLTSPHFIQQYFTSFCEDPVLKMLQEGQLNGVEEQQEGFQAALACLRKEQYSEVCPRVPYPGELPSPRYSATVTSKSPPVAPSCQRPGC